MSCLNITTAIRVLLTSTLTVSLCCQALSAKAAEITPERVLAASCLTSYQGTYKQKKTQKAFAYARERETGKHRCGWSYGHKTLEKARSNAIKQCAKRALNAECKIVDENGAFLVQEGDFSLITPLDKKPLTDNEREKLMNEAEPLVQGSCLPFFKEYLNKRGHKAFAYSLDSDGRYACGTGSKYNILDAAQKGAIASCEKNKGKRKKPPQSACRIYAKNNEIVLAAGDYGIDLIEKSDRYLSKGDYKNYLDQARLIIEDESCLFQFKYYLRGSEHQAYYLARDTQGKQACGRTEDAFSPETAKQMALSKCQESVNKKKLNAECTLYALNFDILGKAEDFGITKGEDDYRRAVHTGNLQKVKQYVAEGADVNLVSKDGTSPLFIAAVKGDEGFFHQLLNKGADLGQKANDGSSLLIAAVMGENPNIIRYLLQKGFDINAPGRENNTALHVAFMRFNSYLIGMLMQEGADPNVQNSQGVSGYDLGKKWKVDLDSLKTLDIQRKKDGCTQVFYAARKGDVIALQKMAALNADMNEVCDDGLSPLSFAKNDEKVIRTLVKLGADVNKADEDGKTPLMYSIKDGEDRVKLLLALGADKTIKDNEGNTAYDLAKNKKTAGDGVKMLLK